MTVYNLLLVLATSDHAERWLALAERLIPDGGTIHIRGVVAVPEDKSLSEGARPAREWREHLRQTALDHPAIHDEVEVYVDYQPFTRIVDDAMALPADLLLAQWNAGDVSFGGALTGDALDALDCDIVLLSDHGWQGSGDVLLSLRGGPNMTLGVRVAEALADTGSITLFHVADRRRFAPDLELVMRAVPKIRRTVTAVDDIAAAILDEAAEHKAIVMGATLRPTEAGGAPSVVDVVAARASIPVALVHAAHPEGLPFHAPLPAAPRDEPLSTRVDRWFAENTFHSGEFDDLTALMRLKERQGVTISVALPALNEAETVGTVIETLQTHLMKDVPLIDELVLIDSRSTDDTVAIARSLGIPTFVHQDVLADQVGSHAGKGEALWKSLYVTQGDIIAWIDTDITNIHPRFIYGLLGPLLQHPRIQYVKGYYARPIRVGGRQQAYGGGRVTELVARPMLNLFYPELSGIVQPLSGEYAGRRSALEQVPFFSGYGVETGLLIDLYERFGLSAVAQSDLEVRIHHNQPLVSLSKMSFAILQVFLARIDRRHGTELMQMINPSMKLIVEEPDRFALDVVAIGDVERPPMTGLEAYLARKPMPLGER